MHKILLSLSFISLSALVLPATAQNKLGEYDEIVIKRKGGENAKVTVEIRDGEVFVDGKKLEDFKNDDIAVVHRPIRPRSGGMMGAPYTESIDITSAAPALPRPSAVLGVMTAKEEADGATVTLVSEGSAADKAGLKVGDVITKLNDQAIKEPQELFEAVGALKPGDKVTVTYKRKDKQNKTTATLGKREQVETFEFTPRGEGSPFGSGDNSPFFRMPEFDTPRGPFSDFYIGRFGDQSNKLGMSVQDLEDGNGAKVLRVMPGSNAAKAGFEPDDIITDMAGKAVKNAKDVSETYQANKEKGTMDVKVKRNGKVQKLSITVPKVLNTENL